MANRQETGGGQWKRADPSIYIKAPPPHHALTFITERANPSLVTHGWVCGKPCLMTTDTKAYITVARLDIAAGWPQDQNNVTHCRWYLGKPSSS
jgi:hypothetical protein